MPFIEAIAHLKFPVADIQRSTQFYEHVFAAKRIAEHDHRTRTGDLFAVILDVPGAGTQLQLRIDPDAARAQRGWNPVAFSTKSVADLERLIAHLDEHHVSHSAVLTGIISWLVVLEDPDGRLLRVYTTEQHGPEVAISRDEHWLGNIDPAPILPGGHSNIQRSAERVRQ